MTDSTTVTPSADTIRQAMAVGLRPAWWPALELTEGEVYSGALPDAYEVLIAQILGIGGLLLGDGREGIDANTAGSILIELAREAETFREVHDALRSASPSRPDNQPSLQGRPEEAPAMNEATRSGTASNGPPAWLEKIAGEATDDALLDALARYCDRIEALGEVVCHGDGAQFSENTLYGIGSLIRELSRDLREFTHHLDTAQPQDS